MVRNGVLSLLLLLGASSSALAQSCAGSPLAVQILGSGGPQLNAERASAGYLLWVGSQAKVVVDMGGGSQHRYAQSGAKFTDLALMLVSHVHPDHTSDLPAFMWSTRNDRGDVLPVAGPSGTEQFPGISAFLSRLFDEKTGAWQALGPIVAPASRAQGVVRLDPITVDASKPEATPVFERDGLKVTAFAIPHANVPALAYRIETGGKSVVFSTDQNGTNPKFPDFAKNANVLVMHMAIAAGGTSPLHAAPAVIGRIAKEANVGRLIVGHIGRYDLNAALAELKGAYNGPLTVGADLQCTQVQ